MYNIEKVWKDWKILRFLGEGSFGKVYEIERNNFGIEEHSALKVITIPQSTAEIQTLRSEGMDDKSVTSYYEGVIKDFAQEIALMSKLKGSPGIVSYEDYAIVNHQNDFGWDILIRMELLTPIADDMRISEYDQDKVITLGIDLCNALSICHRNSIIHRDIKIDNIFITNDGHFKLGDFGVARTIEKTTSGLSKKGTYSYMAPEVYRGDLYGSKSDIYSLGMVMYKLLNFNRDPFLPLPPAPIKYTDKNNALIKRMKGESFAFPVNADKEIASVIMKACSFNPNERYASVDEMQLSLEALKTKRINSRKSYTPLNNIAMDSGGDDMTISAVIPTNELSSEKTESAIGLTFDTQTDVSKGDEIDYADEIDKTQSAFSQSDFKNVVMTDSKNKNSKRLYIGYIFGWCGFLFNLVMAVMCYPYTILQTLVMLSMLVVLMIKKDIGKVISITYLIASILCFSPFNIVSAIMLLKMSK